MSGSNPLSSKRANTVAQRPHPMMPHAQAWQHVNRMQPDDITQAIQAADYTTPQIGTLAGDPGVTRKDAIRAAADWVGSGKMEPSKAIEFISQIPDDPKAVQPWLRQLYAMNLSALVHLKAAAMGQQQAAQGAPQGVPQPGVPMPQPTPPAPAEAPPP
jgi:hypothetical protein